MGDATLPRFAWRLRPVASSTLALRWGGQSAVPQLSTPEASAVSRKKDFTIGYCVGFRTGLIFGPETTKPLTKRGLEVAKRCYQHPRPGVEGNSQL